MTKQELVELANKINLLEFDSNLYGFGSRFAKYVWGDHAYHFTLYDKRNTDNHTKTIYSFSEPQEAEELFQMVQQVFEGKATFKDFVAKFV